MELLPLVPDPWPQVVEQGFAALVAMVQAWESSAPDENKTPEKRFWQSGQSAIAQTISLLLQKDWLFQADNMEGSALPPLSCVNDAYVLLEFVMSSVTCMEETESLKLKVCRNGTIKIGLETNKIMDSIKFDVGNVVMMTSGRNTMRVGVIKNREKHKGSFETIHVLLRAFCYV
ncbi:40S ribosomal protein S4 [Zea mays]|uniref:40S ribosomal protein S4 n=1 Tax=Zea mays TaxID=4577 RepID=A0A3L6EYB5_MAIZE|nr:40S ribosomal protein S4 [Zea mays]